MAPDGGAVFDGQLLGIGQAPGSVSPPLPLQSPQPAQVTVIGMVQPPITIVMVSSPNIMMIPPAP